MSRKYKHLIVGILLAVALPICLKMGLFGMPVAEAASIVPGSGGKVEGSLGTSLVNIMQMVSALNTFMHVLLLIVLQFLQFLLQADFFNDPAMMSALNTIWRLSRDIVNIGFAIMLIGVSFYIIITAKSDMIKEKITNFVIAVILVNFSWFFPRVIIDVANILTSTVYSVPNMLPGFTCTTLDSEDKSASCKVIVGVEIFPNAARAAKFCQDTVKAAPKTESCPCIDNLECHAIQNFNEAQKTMKPAHAMINGLAVSFARINMLAKVPKGLAEGAGDLGLKTGTTVMLQVMISIVLTFVIQLAVVLPMIGIAVGFLIRIIVLWVTTAFMPFVFIGYVVNGKLGTNVFGNETDIWKEFINAAFMPVMVAIPLTIGFVMLSTVSQIPAPLGTFPFLMNVPLINGVKSWWAMLWMFASIGILWKGTFDALKKSEVAGKVTEKLRGAGEYVMSGAMQLPLLTPLPIGIKGANIGTLVHGPKHLADAVRVTASGTSGRGLRENISNQFGQSKPPSAKDVAKELAAGTEGDRKIVDAIEGLKKGENREVHLRTIREVTRDNSASTPKQTLQRLREIAQDKGTGIHSKLDIIEDLIRKEAT